MEEENMRKFKRILSLLLSVIVLIPLITVSPMAQTAEVTYSASASENDTLAPENAFDGDPTTRWASDEGLVSGENYKWLQASYTTPQTINQVVIDWERANVNAYDIQVKTGDGEWITIYESTEHHESLLHTIDLGAAIVFTDLKVVIKDFFAKAVDRKGDEVDWPTVSIVELSLNHNVEETPVEPEIPSDPVENATEPEVEAPVVEEPTVDRTALETLIETVESTDTTNMTPESVEALNTELEKAKALLANPEATQEEVDAQVQVLQSALDRLRNSEPEVTLITLVDEPTGLTATFLSTAFDSLPELVVEVTGEHAYDISFKIDGLSVQPKLTVKVRIPLNGLNPFDVEVYHINGEVHQRIEKITIVENKTMVEFDAESFSVYYLKGTAQQQPPVVQHEPPVTQPEPEKPNSELPNSGSNDLRVLSIFGLTMVASGLMLLTKKKKEV